MVIEVSRELDLVRTGIDRYTLKTGLKLKSVMDVSISVLKEPRGFIRVLQLILAVLAFATTAGFSTTISFEVECNGNGNGKSEEIEYPIAYPFQMRDNLLTPPDCNGDGNGGGGDDDDDDSDNPIKLPFDFSNAAEFFVATGVITFLYCIIILTVYIFFHQTYTNNNRVPVVVSLKSRIQQQVGKLTPLVTTSIFLLWFCNMGTTSVSLFFLPVVELEDLIISAILTVFWLAGSSAWAQAVVDLKYYMDPQNLFGLFQFCHPDECNEESDGEYATLDVSLVFGFANFLIWLSSLWFIYKETIFHTPAVPATSETQNQTKGDGRV